VTQRATSSPAAFMSHPSHPMHRTVTGGGVGTESATFIVPAITQIVSHPLVDASTLSSK
jgi:hypothetical protein